MFYHSRENFDIPLIKLMNLLLRNLLLHLQFILLDFVLGYDHILFYVFQSGQRGILPHFLIIRKNILSEL